jgi:hypothetical protein
MKKNFLFIIAYAVLTIVFIISVYGILTPTKFGDIHGELYEPLDYYITSIKTNMDEISKTDENSNWVELKTINTNDEKLEKTYNSLVADINECYLLSSDINNEKTKNLKPLYFKNKSSISVEKVVEMNENLNCLDNFEKYNNMILSDNEDLNSKLQIQISIIIDSDSEPSGYRTFEELIYDDVVKMSKISSLSNWLKVEYNSYRK